MISKEDIKKLADLARIELKESETESLAHEIDSILGYVGQVSAFTADTFGANPTLEAGALRNVMREDENPTPAGTHSQALIAEFPNQENNYLKVKKIL